MTKNSSCVLRTWREEDAGLATKVLLSRLAGVNPRWRSPGGNQEPWVAAQLRAADVSQGFSGATIEGQGQLRGFMHLRREAQGAWSDTWWTQMHAWAAADATDLRQMWAHASESAYAAGARAFYAVVAADDPLLPVWQSLSFGTQHVVAQLSEAAWNQKASPSTAVSEVQIAAPVLDESEPLAVLEQLLPATLNAAPVFSPVLEEPLEEATAQWRDTVDDDSYVVRVARVGSEVIGYALACSTEKSSLHSGLLRPQNSATLAQVNVAPQWRRRGVGCALATNVVAALHERGFSTVVTDWRSTNIAADATWRAFGFEPTAYRLQRIVGSHG